MADNLPDQIENELLDALFGTTAFSVTTPVKVALMTANGNDSTPGTEVTGGGYSRQTVTFSAAASGSTSNAAAVEFTNMPACTVVGIEIYDSAGTPKRLAFGALTSSKTLSSGDTLRFAATTISMSLA